MNLKRILCPVDFSGFSDAANSYASALAASTGAQVIYFHVAQADAAWGTTAGFDIERETRRLHRELQDIRPGEPDVQSRWVIDWGVPAEKILEYSHENSIDMIVLGTHGRTGINRMVAGSVAETVIRHAECPVLVIRSGADGPDTSE